ncbi:MAG: ribosomal protein S18-alanine N-acetyltransferase [Elainellaceae cyanobacterium]
MRFLQLTLLTPDFLPEVLWLDQQCFGGLWSQSAYEREIDSPNSILVGLVAREALPQPKTSLKAGLNQASNSPQLLAVGCLWAICEEAHITILAVHPQYRRQGLGQAILVEMLNWAQQRGQEWATLEVRVSNAPAMRLYDTFGFQPVGRRRRYYADTGEDAQILWRKGLQTPAFTQHLLRWRQQIRSRLAQRGWGLKLIGSGLSEISR